MQWRTHPVICECAKHPHDPHFYLDVLKKRNVPYVCVSGSANAKQQSLLLDLLGNRLLRHVGALFGFDSNKKLEE